MIYINKNNINQKIKVSIVDIDNCIILKFFFEKVLHYTIYSTKLKNIKLTLILTLKQKVENRTIKKIIVFTNNQTTIRSLINSSKKLNLIIIRNIIKKIKQLKKLQITINFQWVSTYIDIENNEKIDITTKKITNWKTVIKRNEKSHERDTNITIF